MATRDEVDPTKVSISWSPVACATRYNVSVFTRTHDDVTTVAASVSSFELQGTDPSRAYRIQVSSRNDSGRGTASSVFTLWPATPAGVTGMRVTYADVLGATLKWTAPLINIPDTYRLTVMRVADQKVVTELTLPGSAAEALLEDVDARGMYVITLQAVGRAGDGPKSRLVIGDEKPNPVKSVGAAPAMKCVRCAYA